MCKIVLTNVYVFVAGEILYISFYQITEYKICVEEAFYMNTPIILTNISQHNRKTVFLFFA